MTKISRRKFTGEFKIKAVIEAIKEQQRNEALRKKYVLHAGQINI
jgi:hypothetical protein